MIPARRAFVTVLDACGAGALPDAAEYGDAGTHTLRHVAEAEGGLDLPALVDKPDDAVERAYTGWPDGLYVVDTHGRIAFKSAPGPFGFKTAPVRETLQRLVG